MFIKRIEVVSYIETTGDEKFKNFLFKPFSFNMLDMISVDINIEVIFDEWKGKNMGNWYKFKNDDNYILEFYSTEYTIIFPDGREKQSLKIPSTINDFINDMNRFNIALYWSKWIDINFEPKQYLKKSDIRNYYQKLLNKMEKSHELL